MNTATLTAYGPSEPSFCQQKFRAQTLSHELKAPPCTESDDTSAKLANSTVNKMMSMGLKISA